MKTVSSMVEEDLRKMKTLAGQLVELLCDVFSYRAKRCECEDPLPRTYRCVYGTCEIIRCASCHKAIKIFAGRCNYPYSSDE